MKYLKDYIEVIENVLSDELCDRIIAEFSDENEWYDAEIFSGIEKNVRNCKIIGISKSKWNRENAVTRQIIDDSIFASISKIFKKLNKKYSYLGIESDSGYDLLKYDEGGFYAQHTDNGREEFRTISCSISLNNDYKGGEFAFFDREFKYKLKKGSAIIFPSNFMYPHEIMPVTKGIRYSIITWFN